MSCRQRCHDDGRPEDILFTTDAYKEGIWFLRAVRYPQVDDRYVSSEEKSIYD